MPLEVEIGRPVTVEQLLGLGRSAVAHGDGVTERRGDRPVGKKVRHDLHRRTKRVDRGRGAAAEGVPGVGATQGSPDVESGGKLGQPRVFRAGAEVGRPSGGRLVPRGEEALGGIAPVAGVIAQ